MPKIGDTVRFLNDVGGGVIVKIDGRIAYVRDPADGFETPMPLSECIAIPSVQPSPLATEPPSTVNSSNSPLSTKTLSTKPDRPLTAALIFEPHDIRRLSQTAFDLYLVNDSNFRILYAVSSRASDISDWNLIAAGEADGNVQVFLDEFAQIDINSLAHICVQIIAFHSDKSFELMPPYAAEISMDLTRFAKLHCFTSTDYSSSPVLTVPIVTAGKTAKPLRLNELIDEYSPTITKKDAKELAKKPKQEAKAKKDEPKVVDLHIHELLDSTTGLEPADMLACQLREFDRQMEIAAKRPGSKIIFIHGKGEGVLRHAILDRLRRRWPRCKAQDASFREYGFGATQITVHK